MGDFGGIHKTTTGKIIKHVTRAIQNLRNNYIFMPRNEDELVKCQTNFYNVAHFPRVIGAIDGTHIRMLSPGGQDAENFRNRKGFFSINVQAVSNSNYMINDIVSRFSDSVSRWPGATHDSTIFDHSAIKARFERNEFNLCILLGDSAYALKPYLMTPLANPNTPAEKLYNEAHIRTRTIIERCFGIWKRRFPILSLGMRCQLPLVQDIIVATAILHNIARLDSLPDDFNQDDEEEREVANNNHQINIRNNEQNQFIDYFHKLLNT